MMIDAWQAGAGILASSVIVAGGAIAVVRHMLQADFVPRGEHDALDDRVDRIEKHIVGMPTEHSFRELTDRVADVDKRVAVAQTTIEGVNAGLKRVDHNVGLVLQRMLERDKT